MKSKLLKIQTQFIISLTSNMKLAGETARDILNILDLKATDDTQHSFARLCVNENGDAISIKPTNNVKIIGGNTTVDGKLTEFDTKVSYNESFIIITLLEQNNTQGGYFTNGTFADDFRAKNDLFRLTTDEVYAPLAKYNGYGCGYVKVNISTQQAEEIHVHSGSQLENNEGGTIIAVDDDFITLACDFSSACANTSILVA
tara:strand:- start:4650 stop:5252 length:603 start_codon:yes stop_codon:yes gene_type:complete